MRILRAVAIGAVLALAPAAAGADPVLDTLYEAAKEEGTVSLVGVPSTLVRNELTAAFSQRYPAIAVEYVGMPGNQIGAKLRAEQRASVYAVDAIVSGTNTGVLFLKPMNALGPLDPEIVSADARDPTKWMNGGLAWSDPAAKTLLAMSIFVLPTIMINTDLVKPGEITSDRDLLDPKWQGKLATNTPTLPGASAAVFRRFHDAHGEAYLKALSGQNLGITNDVRQLVDWVAKGRYAVAIGFSPQAANVYLDQGVKNLDLRDNFDWKDTSVESAGFGALMVPSQRPHPNAARLFINWILTQEGQTALVKAMQYPSRRLDVAQDTVPEYLRPVAGRKYIASYTDEHLLSPNQQKMIDLVKTLNFKPQ